MSARAILSEAYRADIVPTSLYGKTQHKTLQARLSEDIVAYRERSHFFRTAPGRFFLNEFLDDAAIPEEFRQPIPTRRRFRELMRGPALAVEAVALRKVGEVHRLMDPRTVFALFGRNCVHYDDPKKSDANSIFIRSFVCVYRRNEILTYRLGRYRDDRDTFMSRRSIGFSTLVHVDENTLFNMDDLGIVESGIRATKVDLDIPILPYEGESGELDACLTQFVWATEPSGVNDLLAIVTLRCPDWFEPMKRRLALNDLRWLDITTKINDLDDFDPWSKCVLQANQAANRSLWETSSAYSPAD
jgi:hypothetical protein